MFPYAFLMITSMNDVLLLVLSLGLGLFFLMCSIFVFVLIRFVVSLNNLSIKGEDLMDQVNTYVTLPATALYALLKYFKK